MVFLTLNFKMLCICACFWESPHSVKLFKERLAFRRRARGFHPVLIGPERTEPLDWPDYGPSWWSALPWRRMWTMYSSPVIAVTTLVPLPPPDLLSHGVPGLTRIALASPRKNTLISFVRKSQGQLQGVCLEKAEGRCHHLGWGSQGGAGACMCVWWGGGQLGRSTIWLGTSWVPGDFYDPGRDVQSIAGSRQRMQTECHVDRCFLKPVSARPFGKEFGFYSFLQWLPSHSE